MVGEAPKQMLTSMHVQEVLGVSHDIQVTLI